MSDTFALPLSGVSVSPEEIVAEAVFPGDARWFAGHFPDQPVLPGMALVALALEAVMGALCREGRPVRVTGISRVRFRRPLRPGEGMGIRIQRPAGGEPGGRYPFALSLAGEVVCSGILDVAPVPPPEQMT